MMELTWLQQMPDGSAQYVGFQVQGRFRTMEEAKRLLPNAPVWKAEWWKSPSEAAKVLAHGQREGHGGANE